MPLSLPWRGGGLATSLGARERSDPLLRQVVLADEDPFVRIDVPRSQGESQREAKAVELRGGTTASAASWPRPSARPQGARRSSERDWPNMNSLHYAGNEHAASGRLDLVIIRRAVHLVVPALYLYSLSFNYLPDDIRLNVAGGLALAHVSMALSAVLARPGLWSAMILVSVFIMALCWAVSYVAGPENFDVRIVSRDLVPYLMAIWILSYPEAIPRRMVGFLAIGALVLGTALAFAGDPLIVDSRSRLASITGGPTGLHPSAYFILGNVLVVDQLRRSHLVGPVLAWTIIGVGAFVLLLYQVRTTWLMLVIYIFSGYFGDRPNEFHRTLAFLASRRRRSPG